MRGRCVLRGAERRSPPKLSPSEARFAPTPGRPRPGGGVPPISSRQRDGPDALLVLRELRSVARGDVRRRGRDLLTVPRHPRVALEVGVASRARGPARGVQQDGALAVAGVVRLVLGEEVLSGVAVEVAGYGGEAGRGAPRGRVYDGEVLEVICSGVKIIARDPDPRRWA